MASCARAYRCIAFPPSQGDQMIALTRSSVITSVAAAGIGALVITNVTPAQEVQTPPSVVHEVRLAASPAPGALLDRFLLNQLQNCAAICPFIVQGLVTVPIGVAETPAAFLGTIASTGNLLQAIGAAAASVTQPANAAAGGIIGNDLNQVVPRFENGVEIGVVDALNIGAAVLQPGQLPGAIETFREQLLQALNQPLPPPAPTPPPLTPPPPFGIMPSPQGPIEVAAVEVINVSFALAFQAGELLLLGVVQTANSAATTLAATGNIGSAVTAGADTAAKVIAAADGIVTNAVSTAVTNISNSLQRPSMATTNTTTTTTNATRSPPATATPRVAARATAGPTTNGRQTVRSTVEFGKTMVSTQGQIRGATTSSTGKHAFPGGAQSTPATTGSSSPVTGSIQSIGQDIKRVVSAGTGTGKHRK